MQTFRRKAKEGRKLKRNYGGELSKSKRLGRKEMHTDLEVDEMPVDPEDYNATEI